MGTLNNYAQRTVGVIEDCRQSGGKFIMSAPMVFSCFVVLSIGFVAFIVAALTAASELIITKYPRTYFVFTIRKSPFFYVYISLYGVIADIFVFTNVLHLEKYGLSNPWLQALAIGVSIKSLLHIRFFSIPNGGASTDGKDVVPIGPETFIHLFDQWLLKTIELEEFNGVRAFLADWLKQYTDPESVGLVIKANVPEGLLTNDEYVCLVKDLERALSSSTPNNSKKVQDSLEAYLKKLGKNSLRQTFPLGSGSKAEDVASQNTAPPQTSSGSDHPQLSHDPH